MNAPIGFWSYVHDDDDAETGRIVQLARDIVAQMTMINGEEVELFLDRDSVPWGSRWRVVIDEGLQSVAFFIPVLTPRFFKSAECRRELQEFARKAQSLGVRELVMPLLYVDVSELHEAAPVDSLVALVKEFNWVDWTDLRFAERGSSDYRLNVAKLAQTLVDANASAEKNPSTSPIASDLLETDDEDAPGTLDLIADAEEAIPQFTESLSGMGELTERIGEVFGVASNEMNRPAVQAAGMAGRIRVTRELALTAEPLVTKFYELANSFSAELYRADLGLRPMIAQVATEATDGPDELAAACEFFNTLRFAQSQMQTAMSSASELAEQISPLEQLSRDLRPVLRRFRQGLTAAVEASTVIEAWVELADAANLDCANVSVDHE